MRIFALTNEYNQEYALTSLQKGFATAPEGLGYEMDYSHAKLGYSWVQNYFRDKQQTIKCSVVFGSEDPYNAVSDFLKFIRASKKLALIYRTTAGEYQRDVDFVQFEKTEKAGATLECPIVLVARSLWYSNEVTRFSVSVNSSSSMRYPYKWGEHFNAALNGTISIENDGSVDAPFTAVWSGPIVNPRLDLYENDVLTSTVVINGEAQNGETIEYSTVDGDLYCYYVKANGTKVNLMSGLNIENNNFFKIPVGSSQLKITADTDITKPVTFQIRKLYRAV